MPSVTVWALESDYDAKVVKCLADKLIKHLELSNVFIRAVGKRAMTKRGKAKKDPSNMLRQAVKNYLKQDDCLIFVIDTDGPMSSHQRKQEHNSLINQVNRVISDTQFEGRVYLAKAKCELEAWLLVDCGGIACYFAGKKRKAYRDNCREKITSDKNFMRLIKTYQRGNTELIVEAVSGGKGVKEYLVEFSKSILKHINPNMPLKNLKQEKYHECLSPDIAEYIEINRTTLNRNESLRLFGKILKNCLGSKS